MAQPSTRFSVGELLIHSNPEVGISSIVNFRGYHTSDEAAVMFTDSGFQMLVKVAHLKRQDNANA